MDFSSVVCICLSICFAAGCLVDISANLARGMIGSRAATKCECDNKKEEE